MAQTITKASHPLLFAACETISHDAGGLAGWPSHSLPDDADLALAEAALDTLTAEERNAFAIGEEREMAALAQRSAALAHTHRLLTAFWEHHLPRPRV